MATAAKTKNNPFALGTPKPNITIRPTPEDQKLIDLLHRKLGVDTSQIFRLAIRVLAAKEGVTV
jgi:hypothetical protein